MLKSVSLHLVLSLLSFLGIVIDLRPSLSPHIVVYIPALVLGGFSWARGNQLEYSFIRSQRKYALAGIVAGALLTVICYATQRDYQVKSLEVSAYPAVSPARSAANTRL